MSNGFMSMYSKKRETQEENYRSLMEKINGLESESNSLRDRVAKSQREYQNRQEMYDALAKRAEETGKTTRIEAPVPSSLKSRMDELEQTVKDQQEMIEEMQEAMREAGLL